MVYRDPDHCYFSDRVTYPRNRDGDVGVHSVNRERRCGDAGPVVKTVTTKMLVYRRNSVLILSDLLVIDPGMP